MNKTKISWSSNTWNPSTGCDKISPGCKYCYAKLIAMNLKQKGVRAYKNGFNLTCHSKRLNQPYYLPPNLIFVNSMSDAFHKGVPFKFLKRMFDIMNRCPQHEFQILTKRSKYLVSCASKLHWTKNIWMGVSVENEDYRFRIDHLRQVESEVRFLSVEPLIGEIREMDLTGIHWVIVGGESGIRTRPMKKEWVERIQSICKEQEVPFFFKQWGKIGNNPDKFSDPTVNKSHPLHEKGGRMLNRKIYDQLPKGKEFVLEYLKNKRVA